MRFSATLLRQFAKMTKSALMIVAEGAEEMEVVITVDVLRRAGVDVSILLI